jgi:hypothetical protein
MTTASGGRQYDGSLARCRKWVGVDSRECGGSTERARPARGVRDGLLCGSDEKLAAAQSISFSLRVETRGDSSEAAFCTYIEHSPLLTIISDINPSISPSFTK